MEKRRCPNCNAQVKANARYCPECGKTLRPSARRGRRSRPGWPAALLLGGGVVLLIGALLLFVIDGGANDPAQLVDGTQNIPYPDVPRIPVGQAKEFFDAGEALFVDTRQVASYQEAHIPGAVLLPSNATEADYAALPQDTAIITYCT